MPNMRTISEDERAKLARAYMRGGMAPYQAARNTGFMRVGIMQMAIKVMESREAEEQTMREQDVLSMQYGQKADNVDPALVDEEQEPVQSTGAELCEDEEQKTVQPIYPFLKPGEVKKAQLELTMQTERLMIRLYEKDGRRMFQVTDRRTGRYLQLPQQVVREMKNALGLCLSAMNMQEGRA